MRFLSPLLGIVLFLCVSCKKPPEKMEVTETRRLSTKDQAIKLFASSDERFRDAKPSPVKGKAPQNWLALPASQFRELNYRFGKSGTGEVYVTLASGSVADNANRWFGQFGRPKLSPAEIDALAKLPIAGTQGVWIEAKGEYGSGMGGGSKPGYGLAGVIAQIGETILTLKMVGPEAEVETEKEALKAFAASLEMTK